MSKQILDTSEIESASLLGFRPDVILVGSGPAGASVVTRLASKGLSVCIIEAGGQTADPRAYEFFEYEENDAFGYSVQFGGSSNLWSGRCAPLEPFDISKEHGWPFSYSDLARCYDDAARFLGLADLSSVEALAETAWLDPAWASLVKDPGFSIKKFQWNQPPFNASDALSALLEKKDYKIQILLNCRALRLNLQNDGTVAGIVVCTGRDEKIELKARAYVLAAGGIETPRLLLNSGRGDGRSIGNSNVVGRYLVTHPKGNIARIELARPAKVASPLFSDRRISGAEMRFGIGLDMADADPASDLNHYVQLTPRFEHIGLGLIERARTTVGAFQTSTGRRNGLAAKLADHCRFRVRSAGAVAGRVMFNVVGKLGIYQGRATKLLVRGFFDQYPNPENRVALSTSVDRFGMPKAAVKWSFSREDKESVRSFVDRFSDACERHGVGQVSSLLPPVGDEWPLTGIHSHFMGTTRMGNDPGASVADGYGQVHGVRNLFISGPSLFPSSGYANPVLSICAVGFRVADGIAATIGRD